MGKGQAWRRRRFKVKGDHITRNVQKTIDSIIFVIFLAKLVQNTRNFISALEFSIFLRCCFLTPPKKHRGLAMHLCIYCAFRSCGSCMSVLPSLGFYPRISGFSKAVGILFSEIRPWNFSSNSSWQIKSKNGSQKVSFQVFSHFTDAKL